MSRRRWPGLGLVLLVAAIGAGAAFVRQEQAAAPPKLTQQSTAPVIGSLTPVGVSALRAIADAATNPDLRWPDFAPYRSEFVKVYEKRAYCGFKTDGCARRAWL